MLLGLQISQEILSSRFCLRDSVFVTLFWLHRQHQNGSKILLKMAPSAASYLRGACLLDTVEAMASTLATDGVVTVQEPSVDLTNGILLDLYRFVDRSEHRKIVVRPILSLQLSREP